MVKLPDRGRIFALGVLTILPSVLAAVSLIHMMAVLFGLWVPTQEEVAYGMMIIAIVGVWSVVLGIYYARHFLQNENIPMEKRTISSAIALIGNLNRMPRYWYVHVYSRGCSPKPKNDARQEGIHEGKSGT